MALKRFIAASLAVMLLAAAASLAAGGGTGADPVATLSYIEKKVIPQFNANLDAAVSSAEPALAAIRDEALQTINGLDTSGVQINSSGLDRQIEYEAYMRLMDDGFLFTSEGPVTVRLAAGERLIVAEGGEMRLMRGAAKLAGERAAEIVNVTSAVLNYASMPMNVGTRYVVTDGERLAGAETASGADILVSGSYQVLPAARPRHTDAAFALRTLGVMRGASKGFELGRSATRLEALIMFIRLLGEEDEALAYTGACPFTDLPAWNNGEPAKYAGYAYSKGYALGVGNSRFDPNSPATAEMYMTFLLRALGYSEDAGDFDWADAPSAAERLGVITAFEHDSLLRQSFIRDSMAYVSWRALSAKCKNGTVLAEKLMDAGAFTERQYAAAGDGGVRLLG